MLYAKLVPVWSRTTLYRNPKSISCFPAMPLARIVIFGDHRTLAFVLALCIAVAAHILGEHSNSINKLLNPDMRSASVVI